MVLDLVQVERDLPVLRRARPSLQLVFHLDRPLYNQSRSAVPTSHILPLRMRIYHRRGADLRRVQPRVGSAFSPFHRVDLGAIVSFCAFHVYLTFVQTALQLTVKFST